MARIYLASSWRNADQPATVETLRRVGHKVYDFRNADYGPDLPKMGCGGFAWSEVDPDWQSWDAATYREKLKHPRSRQGFRADFDAMKWCNVCILLLPCGRSAHLELGWCAGQGKRTIIWTRDGEEPELMALMATDICISKDEVLRKLGKYERSFCKEHT